MRYGHTARDLPNDDELIKEAKQLAETLGQLRKAPVVDSYSGPVLFEGEGAAGIVRNARAGFTPGSHAPPSALRSCRDRHGDPPRNDVD